MPRLDNMTYERYEWYANFEEMKVGRLADDRNEKKRKEWLGSITDTPKADRSLEKFDKRR